MSGGRIGENSHIQKVLAMSDKVISLRENYGLTYANLAQRFDVSERMIRKIVRRHKNRAN